ncbi:TonB-dependent receptor [Marinilongibacter aquaticus]|uniref:TonB-dependent receptor n=1 Tax=Marinilongibacter aquaticus TaxID=2975157 RepID=UPI0021BD45FC|nr:TonB-dependent receptor [Marinilongibacter aquaticus]UBM58740.1 TonB-dependent receptor [Marinilongibacter aquaticus]
MRKLFNPRILALTLLLSPLWTHAQNRAKINANISGLVVDKFSREPLVGATVNIKGTTNGALTNAKGEFGLSTGQTLPFVLLVSSIGYKPQEYVVSGNTVRIELISDQTALNEVVVTSRRRAEPVQGIPIPISVISGTLAEDAGAFNVNRVKEFVPSVQLYSSNPRNTTLNIRGLGSTFGLTNDGIDPGVGFYVDGVYYARPAATALDFIDIERIEVLRGPQGTLFGKNTTAGAFNIITREASFIPGASFDVSYGNYGYVQAKAAITGPISKKVAARLSFSGTQRDGVLTNVRTNEKVNDINNLGLRAQLLFRPSENLKITLTGDNTDQNPNGYAQVIAGVVTTKRPAFRQFGNIIADLGYTLPSENPFDRLIDTNSPWRSKNELGGVSINGDLRTGGRTLTSTTAWRYWNWGPSNDRDFTGLPVLNKSQAPSRHDQWSQEIRYSGEFSKKLSGVTGVFYLCQLLVTDPVHTEESGAAQWRFSQNNQDPLWETPGLLDGYKIETTSRLESVSAAVYGQLDWQVAPAFHLLPGLRYNYDKKKVDYNRIASGGLQTEDPSLIALKNRIYTSQKFTSDVVEGNFSGQLTAAYKPNKKVNAFGTFSTSYKPVGINLGGLPTENGRTLTELAEIKPEYTLHYELGIKTLPAAGLQLNVVAYNTDIKDYQTRVQTPDLSVNRGYVANAEKVRVSGLEIDGNYHHGSRFTVYGNIAYTYAKYVSFTNAPVPLEDVGGEMTFIDISGGRLPGVSKWAGALGAEVVFPSRLISKSGNYFFALETSHRSGFSSSPSPSQFLNIDGYSLVNGRIGFRATDGLTLFLWGRNILDRNYFEQLLAASGSAGHYAAVLGDPRTYGTTLRYTF